MSQRFIKIGVAANGAGSGKDFLAEGFARSNNLKRIGFADPIKEVVARALGVERETVEAIKMGNVSKEVYDLLPPGLQKVSPQTLQARMRRILQLIGTEVFREEWYDETWIHRTLLDVRQLEFSWTHDSSIRQDVGGVVVTDVRFPNEFNALRHAGFYMVDLDAPEEFKHLKRGSKAYDHPSERSLDEYRLKGLFDQCLWNDRSQVAYDLALDVINTGMRAGRW